MKLNYCRNRFCNSYIFREPRKNGPRSMGLEPTILRILWVLVSRLTNSANAGRGKRECLEELLRMKVQVGGMTESSMEFGSFVRF